MQQRPSYHLEIQVEVVLKEGWSVMSGSFALKYEWLICMKNMKGLRKCGLKRGVVSLVGVFFHQMFGKNAVCRQNFAISATPVCFHYCSKVQLPRFVTR